MKALLRVKAEDVDGDRQEHRSDQKRWHVLPEFGRPPFSEANHSSAVKADHDQHHVDDESLPNAAPMTALISIYAHRMLTITADIISSHSSR